LFSFRLLLAQCGDPSAVATIPAVRGKGSPSACAGQAVTVTGIVTLSAGGLKGFFLQDAVGDADPSTSDAIFVLTGSADNLPAAGSLVRVTGQVVEVKREGQPGSITRLEAGGGAVQITGAATLPEPIVLDPGPDEQNVASNPYFQALEGMLVTYPPSTVVTPTDEIGQYFVLRNDRLPESGRVTPQNPGTGLPVMVGTAGGAVVRAFNTLDGAPQLTGVLQYDFGSYRLEPSAAYDGQSAEIAASSVPNDEPFFSVATLDCVRLTADLPAAEKQTRIAKLALAVRNQLGSPDIIAAFNVGDAPTLNQLAQAAGDYFGLFLRGCNPTNIGLLFKLSRISPVRTVPFEFEAPALNLPACTLPNGEVLAHPAFENPLLRVDVILDAAVPITVIMNDWRSAAADSAIQARLGTAGLITMLDAVPSDYVVVFGDFEQSEGSAALTAFETNTGYVNLSRRTDAQNRYSITRNGRSEAVDHILVSPSLKDLVMSSGFAHYNADFSVVPYRQDAATPVRASDHDGAFVHFMYLP
jgi:predicted extracellular nuclease